MGLGLTLRPTPHRLEVGGRSLFAWDALDALFALAYVGRPARIESPCPGTGEPVRIAATPAGVASVEPPSAVVSIVEPRDLASVRSVFCANVRFFRSPGAAARWLEEHPGATLLPVADAFRLVQLLGEGLLPSPAAAG